MPVPSPSSGSDRWRIDFLMVDQDATPTFVEVKRLNDTRSRREVVAQMLDYAANGHYYWEKSDLRNHAEATAVKAHTNLEARLNALAPVGIDGIDAFFEKMQENLREGQVRLVFFLEEAPMELKSLVDFLNRQMERSEVLLVEAQLFEQEGQRFVVPTLFGYSEEARRTKRTVTATSDHGRQKRLWDKESFFAELTQKAGPGAVEATRKLYDFAASLRPIKWGGGWNEGSFPALIISAVSGTSLLTVYSSGVLALGFPDNESDPSVRRLSARLHALANGEYKL